LASRSDLGGGLEARVEARVPHRFSGRRDERAGEPGKPRGGAAGINWRMGAAMLMLHLRHRPQPGKSEAIQRYPPAGSNVLRDAIASIAAASECLRSDTMPHVDVKSAGAHADTVSVRG
jgi:hypothetical protein